MDEPIKISSFEFDVVFDQTNGYKVSDENGDVIEGVKKEETLNSKIISILSIAEQIEYNFSKLKYQYI